MVKSNKKKPPLRRLFFVFQAFNTWIGNTLPRAIKKKIDDVPCKIRKVFCRGCTNKLNSVSTLMKKSKYNHKKPEIMTITAIR